ncbi:MAG: hypothetical protein AB1483_05685 [Candidatus Zixiibacteriota bacterium]
MKNPSIPARYVAVLLIIIFISVFSTPARSTDPPVQWGDLFSGPYPVGFTTIEKYDYSRVFQSKVDYDGDPREGERARPVQVCIWYPAEPAVESAPMVYGEYVFPAPDDSRFYGLLSQLQGRELGYLMAAAGNRAAPVADVMNMTVGAVKNAAPQEGAFPIVIYFADLQSGFSENSVLCEYLASQGYIVAATHSVGTLSLNAALTAGDLETQVRDREFALAQLHGYPNADTDRLAVIGCGWGGVEALMMQMRNSDVDAIVTLDGAYLYKDNAELIKENPSFDFTGVKVPSLQMYPGLPDAIDPSVCEAMPYSERYFAALKRFTHPDFTHYPALLPDSAAGESVDDGPSYATVCEYVLGFLNAYVSGEQTALAALDAVVSEYADNLLVQHMLGQKPPPTELEFVDLIQQGKIDRAIEIYQQLKAARPGDVFFQEATINVMAYRMLQSNQIEDAVKLFKLNAEAFENSANVWDSYADGCIANGDIETAAMCYRKVLEVIPTDSVTPDATKEIIVNNARQFLESQGQ